MFRQRFHIKLRTCNLANFLKISLPSILKKHSDSSKIQRKDTNPSTLQVESRRTYSSKSAQKQRSKNIEFNFCDNERHRMAKKSNSP